MDILVVDDSSTMRKLVNFAIKKKFPTSNIVEAEDGLKALELLPTQDFKLIIADLNMPKMNGFEFVSIVKQGPATASIPVIFLTTEAGEKEREKGMELGAAAYLTKPFKPNELQSLLESIIKP